MNDKIEKEIEAIKTVLTILQELDDEVRKNVLDYVLKRLNFDFGQLNPVVSYQQPPVEQFSPSFQQAPHGHEAGVIHIKQFKETKQPRTAIEMVVIVAYYLQYIAELEKRKNMIGTSDLETWFRIADFPLPNGELRYTMANAKNSGYLDSAGHGEYKLNAIGYNLVKHNMPRGESSGPRKAKRTGPKKAAKAAKKSTKK